jgi:hypothetical protein
MAENVLQTLQKFVQDVIAPDVRETKVRVEAISKEMDARFNGVDARFAAVDARFAAIDKRFDSLSKEGEAQFKAILTAIAEAKAQIELAAMSEIYPLRERVAVLEAQRN